ncbi:MAG: hypothetical protein J6A23_06145 [Thermoguttaceae bacterium]|nr:hypothetical protein [Thermoguttaceae bacterium]MBP3692818.1 hypothetical protein [Thermoguttaceae bacterium]
MKADEIQNLIQNVNQRKIWLTDGTNANCRTLPPSESHIDHEDLKTIQKDIQQMVPNFLKSPIPEMQDVTVQRMKYDPDLKAWIPDQKEIIGSIPSHFPEWTLPKAAADFPESFILRPKYSPIEHWENFISQSKELTDQMIWRPLSNVHFEIMMIQKERNGDEESESRWIYEDHSNGNPLQYRPFGFENRVWQENYFSSQISPAPMSGYNTRFEIRSRLQKLPVEIVLHLEIQPQLHSEECVFYSDFGECTVDLSIPQGITTAPDDPGAIDYYLPTILIRNSMKNARYITISQRLEPGESLTVGQTEFSDFGVPETMNSLLNEAQKISPNQLAFQCQGGNIWRYLCGRFRVLD